ncbi:MAG: helix-turn-helix transcriptional regulator [Candidatus Heimdallarchaeota archaeon]|nr:helix-turn-helix transcriptional regulator [Candidatus Heimdallarchaeota archaeon]
MEELGIKIKGRRKTLGITQKHLAELAGVNPNTIIRIENGKINPTIEVVNSIADVLGMELTISIKKISG